MLQANLIILHLAKECKIWERLGPEAATGPSKLDGIPWSQGLPLDPLAVDERTVGAPQVG